jgi:hypothetical protein
MLCRVLLHAVNLRHGTYGFTSPLKEVRAMDCKQKLKSQAGQSNYVSYNSYVCWRSLFTCYRSGIPTSYLLSMLFYWVVMPWHREDGDSMFLQNFGIYVWVHTATQPRRMTSTSSLPWKPQIFHICWYDLGNWLSDLLTFQIGSYCGYLTETSTELCPPLCSIEDPCYGLRTLHYTLQHFHGHYDSTYLLNKVSKFILLIMVIVHFMKIMYKPWFFNPPICFLQPAYIFVILCHLVNVLSIWHYLSFWAAAQFNEEHQIEN